MKGVHQGEIIDEIKENDVGVLFDVCSLTIKRVRTSHHREKLGLIEWVCITSTVLVAKIEIVGIGLIFEKSVRSHSLWFFTQ